VPHGTGIWPDEYPRRTVRARQKRGKDFAAGAVDFGQTRRYIAAYQIARMAELVDALVSGTSVARRGGSSPLPGTKIKRKVV
jgi:hypothetical protein